MDLFDKIYLSGMFVLSFLIFYIMWHFRKFIFFSFLELAGIGLFFMLLGSLIAKIRNK